MISDSRRVSDATVNHVGGLLESIGPEATLSQALDGRAGVEVLNKLVDDGVIPDQSRAAYVKETKLGDVLTEEGKERVTRLMVGRFFEDPDQLTKLPEVRNQVERVAAPLSQVDSIKDWSLTPKVQEAVTILERAHDLNIRNLDDFFQQDNIFGAAKFSAEAVDLARALKSAPAEVIKGAARQYAGDAIEASRGASMFGDVSTPEDAFKAAFSPEALEKRAAELKALRDAARKPAPANALAEKAPAEPAPANALAGGARPKRSKSANVLATAENETAAGKPTKKAETVELHRGLAQGQSGNYYSTDRDFAREFTQSGLDSEIRSIRVPKSDILDLGKDTPFAGNEDEIAAAIKKAMARKAAAFYVSEGANQPRSVYFLKPPKSRK
jgi:hypothetical protein